MFNIWVKLNLELDNIYQLGLNKISADLRIMSELNIMNTIYVEYTVRSLRAIRLKTLLE